MAGDIVKGVRPILLDPVSVSSGFLLQSGIEIPW